MLHIVTWQCCHSPGSVLANTIGLTQTALFSLRQSGRFLFSGVLCQLRWHKTPEKRKYLLHLRKSYYYKIPSSLARATAWARLLLLSLTEMCFIWALTVSREISSSRAISGLERPAETRRKTLRSRSLRSCVCSLCWCVSSSSRLARSVMFAVL